MVRSLELEFSGPGGQEIASLLRSLHINGSKHILPNLYSLSVTVTQIPQASLHLHPLLSHSLEWLQVVFETEAQQPENTTDAVIASFTDVINSVGNLSLDVLSISVADERLKSSSMATDAVGRLIGRNPSLTYTEINDFHYRLSSPFISASKVPHLREAQFSVLSFSSPIANIAFLPQQQDIPPQSAFVELETLAVDLASRDTDHVLSLVSHAPLTSLRLHLEQPGEKIDRSLRTIGQFGGLKSVTLWFPDVRGEWKDLVPLLACTELRTVDLHGVGMASAVGDSEILAMANSWPRLQKLWLRELPGDADETTVSPSPVLTLSGISRVAERCRELTALAAPVNARPPLPHHLVTGLGPHVRDLWFPHSVLDGNEVDVAQFIAQHWPNHIYPSPSALLGIAEMRDGDPWKEVWNMARDWAEFRTD